MIRINPVNPFELQFQWVSMGAMWQHRYTSHKLGKFLEIEFDEHILSLMAKTEKGIYYSTNGGRSWRNDSCEWDT